MYGDHQAINLTPAGEPGLIPSQYEGLADDVKPGDRVLLADGVMELRVENIKGTTQNCCNSPGTKSWTRCREIMPNREPPQL